MCEWVVCHPCFQAPADLSDTKPCPAQDLLTIHPTYICSDRQTHTVWAWPIHYHSQWKAAESSKDPGFIPALQQPGHPSRSSLYVTLALVPDGVILILTVFMVICDRCTCNLSSSLCLSFGVRQTQIILLYLCVSSEECRHFNVDSLFELLSISISITVTCKGQCHFPIFPLPPIVVEFLVLLKYTFLTSVFVRTFMDILYCPAPQSNPTHHN